MIADGQDSLMSRRSVIDQTPRQSARARKGQSRRRRRRRKGFCATWQRRWRRAQTTPAKSCVRLSIFPQTYWIFELSVVVEEVIQWFSSRAWPVLNYQPDRACLPWAPPSFIFGQRRSAVFFVPRSEKNGCRNPKFHPRKQKDPEWNRRSISPIVQEKKNRFE